jgi:hypothetical protein
MTRLQHLLRQAPFVCAQSQAGSRLHAGSLVRWSGREFETESAMMRSGKAAHVWRRARAREPRVCSSSSLTWLAQRGPAGPRCFNQIHSA